MATEIIQARVSFFVTVETDSRADADKQVNKLLDQLGSVETNLPWDNCEWDYVYASAGVGY